LKFTSKRSWQKRTSKLSV